MISDLSITRPAFVVNTARVRANIKTMTEKFRRRNIAFRPHFKTHQSLDIAAIFHEEGVRKITVSSVAMARFFFDAGWRDITIAFPFNRLELPRLNQMSMEAQINIVLEDADTAAFVGANTTSELGVFIKVDCGYGRTGIAVHRHREIKMLAQEIASKSKLKLSGLLAHFGNNYHSSSPEEVRRNYQKGVEDLNALRQFLQKDFPDLMISAGDTPSAALVRDFGRVDEMRPGNFVYFDWMQYEIGSCARDQIAAIMLCPVVAIHPGRNEVIIHGGAVHFSKEKGRAHYGAVCDISNGFSTKTLEGVFLSGLSQEHGIIKGTDAWMQQIRVGDLVGIIPIHSCLTANLMKEETVFLAD